MTKKEQYLILIGLCVSSFLGCIDFTIVNTALPTIQMDLNASIAQMQWIINIFTIALASFMVVLGRVADLKGHRKILYIGLAIFGIASLGAGFSPEIYTLIFFRFLQGIGVAILYVVPIAIVNSQFPKDTRGKATGIIIAVNGFGLAIGPVIGGMILDFLSWRWMFFVNPPLIIISCLMLSLYLKESISKHPNQTLDIPGFLTLILAIPCVVLFILEGSSNGWFSISSIIFFCLAFILLIGFYLIEKRSKSPIIDFNLFINHTFISALISNFSLAFFYTLAFFLMPLYLHNILGQDSFHIGLLLLPASAMVVILSPLLGSITNKYGPKLLLTIGFTCFIISAYLQTLFSSETHLYYILIAFLFMGIGWACILNPSIIAGLSSLPEKHSAVGMGTIGTLHNFGATIGLTIGTVIFHYFSSNKLEALLTNANISIGPWATTAISDPDEAVKILQENTSLSLEQTQNFFSEFFTHGYHAAFWLLLSISLLAMLIIIFGMNKKKS